jgi:hypothetical protein
VSTRATPSRSFETACRHFFRHLREPCELRRNPLALPYFSDNMRGASRIRSDAIVAQAIQAAVRNCADYCLQVDRLEDEETGALKHAIIVRGDLEGTGRVSLAAELGISARQYSRLQRDIRRRIAVLLSSHLQRENGGRLASFVQTRSPLAQIALIAGRQSPDEALKQLGLAMNASADVHLIAPALCTEALIRLRYLGDVTGAYSALAASRSILEKFAAADTSVASIRADIELALAEIDIKSGLNWQRGIESSTRLAETLSHPGEGSWRRLRALFFAAYGSFMTGKPQNTLRFLGRLLSEVGASKYAPPQESIEILLGIAMVLGQLGRFSESSRMIAEAWLVARRANLRLDALRIDLAQTDVALLSGDDSAARERLPDLCDESRRLSCPNLSAHAHLLLAQAQVRAPHPRAVDILNNAQRALALGNETCSGWISAKAAESFGKLMLGYPLEAERAARAADNAAAVGGNRAVRGTTLRELARVAHAQGRKRDAKRTVIAAVEAAYSVGVVTQVAPALELAAQILRRSDYHKEATALRNALALSAPISPLGYS